MPLRRGVYAQPGQRHARRLARPGEDARAPCAPQARIKRRAQRASSVQRQRGQEVDRQQRGVHRGESGRAPSQRKPRQARQRAAQRRQRLACGRKPRAVIIRHAAERGQFHARQPRAAYARRQHMPGFVQ